MSIYELHLGSWRRGADGRSLSYRAIADRVDAAPSDILFVSDVVAELDAAATAGLRTALCVRKAGSSFDPGFHPRIESFDEIVG